MYLCVGVCVHVCGLWVGVCVRVCFFAGVSVCGVQVRSCALVRLCISECVMRDEGIVLHTLPIVRQKFADN